MKSSLEELASHCLERLNPDFAKQVQSGDIVVGGGILVRDHHGNSCSKPSQLGVTTVIAESFAGFFNEMRSISDCWFWNVKKEITSAKET